MHHFPDTTTAGATHERTATTAHEHQVGTAHFDVVVVGARAAGAGTAMLLARRGLSVLAVDRSAYGSDTLSTHSLARVGVLQLSRWGLLDRLRDAGTPTTNSVVFHYGDEPTVLDVSAPGDVDGLYSPRRTVLDRILVDAARESGASVLHGVSVADLTTDATGRVNGITADIDGTRCHIGATWVIGADGVRSRVARSVDAETTHLETAASAVIYGYWKGVRSDRIHNMFERRGRAVGVIPTNDGETCVWVAMTQDEFTNRARGRVEATYHDEIGSFAGLRPLLHGAEFVGGIRGFAGVPGHLRQAYGRGWALVGDAGYFKDPVSAHGITDAFTSAELLADAIAEAHEGGDEMAALERYRFHRDEGAAEVMPPIAELAALDLEPEQAKETFRRFSQALRAEWIRVSARDAVPA